MLKVTIIGSGNVGFHLVNLFYKSKKITLNEWYSRSLDYDPRVKVVNDIDKLSDSDIYIICVNDDSILKISEQMNIRGKFIVHTSGSTSFEVISNKNRRGVFYPLQTFSKEKELKYSEIPICIDAENDFDLVKLKELSRIIGCKYYELSFQERKTLHLAAIITNNFTNYMFSISKELVESKNLDFNILKPLINETVNKIHKLDPDKAQTGPAKRNDKKILKMHEEMITDEKKKNLYRIISEMINEKYGN